MRDQYKIAIYSIMKNNSKVIAILADSAADEYDVIRKEMPERVIDCGIAEANAIGVAAGVASCGYIPVVYGLGAFLAYRAFEFVRDDICIQNRNVKIVGLGGGVGYNNVGPTHHTTEDIAVMTALPNMTVLSPGTPLEVEPILNMAIEYVGPTYIRMGKAFEEEIHTTTPQITIEKANILRKGNDLTILSTGAVLPDVMRAAKRLEEHNIESDVINVTTLKPIDKESIIYSAKKTRKVLVVEEHNYYGGLYSLATDAVSREGIGALFEFVGFNDQFCLEYGYRKVIRGIYGISEDEIYNKGYRMARSNKCE